jgi:hypothetical protein
MIVCKISVQFDAYQLLSVSVRQLLKAPCVPNDTHGAVRGRELIASSYSIYSFTQFKALVKNFTSFCSCNCFIRFKGIVAIPINNV